MLAHLKQQGAFSVKMGPPVVIRRWDAAGDQGRHPGPGREAAARRRGRRTSSRAPSRSPTGCAAWAGSRARTAAPASATYSPATSSRCRWPTARWRTSTRASTSCGAATSRRPRRPASRSSRAATTTWPSGSGCTRSPPMRDHFRPRPLGYFQRMWTALNAEDPNRMRLYFARHEGVNLSAATMLVVGGHVWYSYGASDNHRARGPALERDAVADAARRLRARRHRLRPARHQRLAGRDRPPLRPDPVQGRHGRRRPPSTSASGTSRSTSCCTRRSTSTCRAADRASPHPLRIPPDTPQPRERFRARPWRSPSTSTPRAGGRTSKPCPEQFPGLVPVCKGNGYGFGHERLADEATRLGSDILAVGTTYEAARIKDWFSGDLLVLTPFRRGEEPVPLPDRVIRSVSSVEGVHGLVGRPGRHRGHELA